MNMKKNKQLITLENLVKFFGMANGTKLFCLRYINRKKYYSILIEKLKNTFSIDIRKIRSDLNRLPLNKIGSSSKNIWVLWYQGFDTAPKVVKSNLVQLQKITRYSKYNIVCLDKNNISKYLKLPDYIIEKVKKGKITLTHLSDIIRAGLLSQYGGIWLDSTCYVKENKFNNINNYIFYTQKYKPGVSSFFNNVKWSGFFMASGRYNPVEVYLYNMFLIYWKKYDVLVDYFLIDIFLKLGYENISLLKQIIDSVPFNNSDILGDEISFKKDTWIKKLNWRKKYDLEYFNKNIK